MFKAYLKAVEMLSHGLPKDYPAIEWCQREGVVRVEIELKRRLLQELGLDNVGAISDAALRRVFESETGILREVDRSDEPNILAAIPARSRMYAAAWMLGHDLKSTVSRRTLFRHVKVCREYGLEIMEPRNIAQFPTKVRVVELRPVEVPDWYRLDSEAA